jgi:hypothetical protein
VLVLKPRLNITDLPFVLGTSVTLDDGNQPGAFDVASARE